MLFPRRAVARSARLGAAALVAALVFAPAVPAQEGPPGEKALPSSTFVLLRVQNAAKLREAVEKSQLGQMLADPAMKAVKDDVASKLEDANRQMKERIGVTIEELLETPQGPAWIALTRKEGENPVSVVIAADAGANKDRMTEVMTKSTDQLKQQGGEVSTEEFKGLTVTTVLMSKVEEQSPPLVWTSKDSIFFLSSDVDALKDVLANAEGREDSLASGEIFGEVEKKLEGDAEFRWFADLTQVAKLLVQVAADRGVDPQQADALMQLFGVNQVKAAGGTVALNQGDFDTVTKTFISTPGPDQGLLRLFQMPQTSLKPESWVPASVASYTSMNWDLDEAYNGLNDLANQFLPGALENLERGLVGPGGETISLQKDLFGPIGDRVTVISDYKKPITEQSQRALFAVALEDAKAFQASLTKVFAIAGMTPKKRDFQGTTIYEIELPEVPNAAQQGIQIQGSLHLTVAKDTLFIGTEPSLLEQVLRPNSEALGDDPSYLAVAKHFPDQVSSISFTRPEEQARLTYDMLKGGQLAQAVEAAGAAGGQDVPDVGSLIDPAKLPEFSVFAKYLAPGGGYSTTDESGLTYIQFTLRKTNP